MLHNAWRFGFIALAWSLTRSVVWLKNHLAINRWLGADMRVIGLRLWSIAWLVFVWILLWGTISWANVITGLVVAIGVVTILPLPRVAVEGRIHILPMIALTIRLVVEFFISSAQVAWLAIRPGRQPMGAVLRARVHIKSDMVLTLAVDYLNLVPGTMVVEIDHRRRLLYVHVIDVSSPQQVERFYSMLTRTEQLFISAFERDDEWRPSPYHGIDDEFGVTARHMSPGSEDVHQ
nr:Na+/H+ antiporter subunit E [Gordonia jinhuaensis]